MNYGKATGDDDAQGGGFSNALGSLFEWEHYRVQKSNATERQRRRAWRNLFESSAAAGGGGAAALVNL